MMNMRFHETRNKRIYKGCRLMLSRLDVSVESARPIVAAMVESRRLLRRHVAAIPLRQLPHGIMSVDLPVRYYGYCRLGPILASAKLAFALSELLKPLRPAEAARWHEVALAICRSLPGIINPPVIL